MTVDEERIALEEAAACTPIAISAGQFNPDARIPYGLTVKHIEKAMGEFVEFLGFINAQLHTKKLSDSNRS